MTVFSQLRLYDGTALNVEQYPPTTFENTKTAVRASGHLFVPSGHLGNRLGCLPTTFVQASGLSGLAAQRFRRTGRARSILARLATDDRRYDPALSFLGVDGKSEPRLWRQAWIGRRSEIAADGGAVLGVAQRQVRCNCDGRDRWGFADTMVAMIRAKAFAICCRRTRTTSMCALRPDVQAGVRPCPTARSRPTLWRLRRPTAHRHRKLDDAPGRRSTDRDGSRGGVRA